MRNRTLRLRWMRDGVERKARSYAEGGEEAGFKWRGEGGLTLGRARVTQKDYTRDN